jgi:hypothetical protein
MQASGRKKREGKDAEWMHQGPLAGCCVHGNEPSGSIKGGKFH